MHVQAATSAVSTSRSLVSGPGVAVVSIVIIRPIMGDVRG
jgi:hypothetical protein